MKDLMSDRYLIVGFKPASAPYTLKYILYHSSERDFPNRVRRANPGFA